MNANMWILSIAAQVSYLKLLRVKIWIYLRALNNRKSVVEAQSCQSGLKVDRRKNERKWPQLSLLNVLCSSFVASTDTHTRRRKHSHTLTFQEDMSDDIWSDSVSPMWFCGDGVKYRAVPASVLIHCDTMRRVRISPGHSLRASKVWPALITSEQQITPKHTTS